MIIFKIILIIVSTILLAACGSSTNEMTGGQGPKVRDIFPPDKNIKTVTPNQAVGFYADGEIINDFYFPLESEGVIKVFRGRNRNFATDNLFDVVSYAAKEIANRYPNGERLQVGDISKEGGGQLSRHASHQNGLDADVAYYRVDHRELDPEGFGAFDELFVQRGKVTANFDVERNYEAFKTLVGTGVVNRIFVDAAIKTRLCQYAKTLNMTNLDRETLRRFRPLENHMDHFHLRINCPLTSPDCITQQEPPAGTGCPAAGQMLFNMFDPSET